MSISLVNSYFSTTVNPVIQVSCCFLVLEIFFMIDNSQIPVSNYSIRISAFLLAVLIMCKSL